MTPDELGAALLVANETSVSSLLDQASGSPECLAWLLAHGARTLQTSPATTVRAGEIGVQLGRITGDLRSAAIASRLSAQGLRALGSQADALDAFNAAREIAREAENEILAAQVMIGAIDSLTWLGRLSEAVSLARDLEATFHRLGKLQDAARVRVNLGIVYYRQDRYAEALECYEAAASALSTSGDAVAAATVDFNRANIYSELLQSERARALFEDAREVFRSNGMSTHAAMCEFNIGVLYHASGQYTAALAAEQRAREHFVEHNLNLEVAKCDADMADVYRMLNLHSEALHAYTSAMSTFEQIPVEYERARAGLGLAAVLAAQGAVREAGEAIAASDIVFRRQKNRLQLAQANLLRAYWMKESGDALGACVHARAAARAYTLLRLPARAAEARYIEAEVTLASGQNAMRSMSRVRRTAVEFSQGWLESRADLAMGRYCVSQGRTADALRHFRAAVDALEAARTLVPGEELHTAFISNKLGVYEDIVALLVSRGSRRDITQALEYVERSKSRLLLERVQSALSGAFTNLTDSPSSGTDTASLAHLSDLRSQLSRMYNQINPDGSDGSTRHLVSSRDSAQSLALVEDAYRSALRAAEVQSGSGVFSLLRVASTRQLQQWLATDETLIEFYVLRGTICAFVVSKSEPVRVFRDLAASTEIERVARRLRYHLRRAGSPTDYVEKHSTQFLDGVQLPLSQLYDMLIRPIVNDIKGERLTIIPHGVLHALPFHALYDTERGEYTLDRWEISYAPSATVRYMENLYANGRSTLTEETESLVIGVPDEGVEQIAVEVRELGAVMPNARVFCGATATLRKFFDYAGKSKLIHLATHALFRADNPLFSGLKFADGWLLARDLYSVRLNCDLVTLSACRTGQAMVESGDEMFGLLRGFLAAGARTVAVSFWPAEDLPTATLMTRFHALMAEGQSRTAALRLAQKYVRRTWQHPYQWAAFALFGER